MDRQLSTLRLTKVTMQDSRRYECSVKIQGDDEGTPSASTSLLVLGENSSLTSLFMSTVNNCICIRRPFFMPSMIFTDFHDFSRVRFFVFFQCLPLNQSVRFREVQSTGKTSPSPAGLRRDPLNLHINGRLSALKTGPEIFHRRQTKVCISTMCDFVACRVKNIPTYQHCFVCFLSLRCRGWSSVSLQHLKRNIWVLHLHIRKSNRVCQLQPYLSCGA